MDPRQVIQHDPAQVKSINDFTNSLAKTLVDAEGTPSKELTRELLADGLRRALDMLGETAKKQFLEILAANIHKFALQEQYSLSRVYPVEISSEYKNLQSFFSETGPEEPAGDERRAEPTALLELRRILAALPQKPGPSAEEFVAKLKDEESSQALKAVSPKTRSGFFAEVRQSLYRLSEASQKELVEFFTELKAEVVKLVDSMTQEVSVWLDEERVASAWQNQAKQASLLTQAQNLFQAVLSPSFQANFKQIGSGAKRAKEAFLLQIAVCLKTGAEKHYWDAPGLNDLAGQMRMSFFFVEGYGELMEDWLQNRTSQVNQEFLQRGTAVLGSNFSEVVSRLRQIFRPGRWMFLSDPRVEGDLITLFLEDSIPRHVVTMTSMTKLLELVESNGGDDFHIYNDIVRLPPLTTPPCLGPADLTESALLEVLKRLPCFPPLLRMTGGRYRFGRTEVVFQLTGTELVAQVLSAPVPVPEVLRAVDFFVQFGPQEFPSAAVDAVKASDTLAMCGTTKIQDVNAPMAPLPSLNFPMTALGTMAPMAPLGSMGVGGLTAPSMPMGSLAMPAFSGPKFGIDDDEI